MSVAVRHRMASWANWLVTKRRGWDPETIGLGFIIIGVGVVLTAVPVIGPAAAQIADAGQSLFDELSAYGPAIAGMGIIVCGVSMIASLQGALYAGVPMVIGGTTVALAPDILGLLGLG
jgi:hypothetical protein